MDVLTLPLILGQALAGEKDLVEKGGIRFGRSHPISVVRRAVRNRLFGTEFRCGRSRLSSAQTRAVEGRPEGTGFQVGSSSMIFASFNQPNVDAGEGGRRFRHEVEQVNAVVFSDVERRKEGKEVFKLPVSVGYISSPKNSYVKHLVRLRQNPKTRSAAESVLVVGAIPLREICESAAMADRKGVPSFLVDVLLLREDAESPEDELAKVSRRIVRVSSDVMSKISGLDSPPELAGVLPFPPSFMAVDQNLSSTLAHVTKMTKWCVSPRRVLVLDSIQDPGNLGTLLRTAAAFAWDAVFLIHGCCDPFNDKALRASRGASFRVLIGTGEWEHVREFAIANELKLFAGDPSPQEEASFASSSSFTSRIEMEDDVRVPVDDGQGLCLVLGSEGQGLSEHVTRDCAPVKIPMPGKFESLNVAVAGGILMFLLRSKFNVTCSSSE